MLNVGDNKISKVTAIKSRGTYDEVTKRSMCWSGLTLIIKVTPRAGRAFVGQQNLDAANGRSLGYLMHLPYKIDKMLVLSIALPLIIKTQ